MLEQLLKSISNIEKDKLLHSFWGTLIFVLVPYSSYIAFLVVFIIAISKEIYDEYKYGGFDWIDIVYTIFIPGILFFKSGEIQMLYLFVLIVLLNLYDFYSTYKILKSGGREINPIVDFAIKKLGLVFGLVVAKAVAIAGAFSLLYYEQLIGLIVIFALYVYVCLHNYKSVRSIM